MSRVAKTGLQIGTVPEQFSRFCVAVTLMLLGSTAAARNDPSADTVQIHVIL
jgi:hypothetical protein